MTFFFPPVKVVLHKYRSMIFSRRSRVEPARIVQWAIVAVFILTGVKLIQMSGPRMNPAVEKINGNDNDVSKLQQTLDQETHETLGAYRLDILDIPRGSQFKNNVALPWSVSYSPLTSQGTCKSIDTITKDLNQIKDLGIRRIRLPSLDCDVLQSLANVPSLHAILGLFVESTQSNADQNNPETQKDSVQHLREIYDQLHELIDSGIDLDHQIDMLVIGSDSGLHNNRYTRRELVRMLKFVRLSLPDYRGLITVAEPIESYISPTRYNAPNSKEYHSKLDDEDLCSAVDVIGLISQPYFNSAMESSHADALIERDVQFGSYLCSDDFIGSAHTPESETSNHIGSGSKPVAVLEAGWPSVGASNGNAVASPQDQMTAIKRLLQATDSQGKLIPINIHSFDDEKWRDPGSLNVETSFGVSRMFL